MKTMTRRTRGPRAPSRFGKETTDDGAPYYGSPDNQDALRDADASRGPAPLPIAGLWPTAAENIMAGREIERAAARAANLHLRPWQPLLAFDPARIERLEQATLKIISDSKEVSCDFHGHGRLHIQHRTLHQVLARLRRRGLIVRHYVHVVKDGWPLFHRTTYGLPGLHFIKDRGPHPITWSDDLTAVEDEDLCPRCECWGFDGETTQMPDPRAPVVHSPVHLYSMEAPQKFPPVPDGSVCYRCGNHIFSGVCPACTDRIGRFS